MVHSVMKPGLSVPLRSMHARVKAVTAATATGRASRAERFGAVSDALRQPRSRAARPCRAETRQARAAGRARTLAKRRHKPFNKL